MRQKNRFNLSMNDNAWNNLQQIKFFFDVSYDHIIRSALAFLYEYMLFLRKYPDAKIYFVSNKEETKMEVLLFNKDTNK